VPKSSKCSLSKSHSPYLRSTVWWPNLKGMFPLNTQSHQSLDTSKQHNLTLSKTKRTLMHFIITILYVTFVEHPARRGLLLTGLTSSLDGVRQCAPGDFLFASESSIHGHQGDGRPRRRQYRHVVTSRDGSDKRCRGAETAIACRDGAG